jgi:predicted Zn-dependent peptidase
MTLYRDKAPGNGNLDLRAIKLPEPEKVKLDSGITLFGIEGGSQELCKIEFIFRAGSDKQPKSLVSAYTNSMLKEGTKTRSSKEISEKLDFYGAFLEHYTTPDTSVVALYTLNKYLAETIPVFLDLVFNATFPEKEFLVLNRRQQQQFRVNRKKVQYLASKRFRPVIFGKDHPYGKEVNENSFKDISTEDLKAFYKNYYVAGNARIIISGQIDKQVFPLLNKYIPESSESGFKAPELNFSINGATTEEILIPVENVVQSAVRMGSLVINRTHEDYAKAEFTCAVLGGYFGSRLMKNIREDKGYTYGIGSRMVPLKNGAYFSISAEVGTDVTEATITEVRREMKRLRTEEMPLEELALVKNYLRGSLIRNFDGAMALGERFREMSDADLDNTFYQKAFDTVETITTQEIMETAERYFHEDGLSVVVAGKR